MAITLKDIAEQTGVSPSVVSTVLSGRDNGTFVSEITRRKVLQVAEMLNYTPVRSGRPRGSRRLRRQREEHFIAIWDPEYSSYTAHYVKHLQLSLRKYADAHDADVEDDYGLRLLTADDLPKLDALGIMGIVLLNPTLLPREAATATIPCVMVGEVDNAPRELIQVHPNEFLSARQLGEYLLDIGHRRIAFVAPGAYPRTTRQRFQGLQSSWITRQLDSNLVLPAQYDAIKNLPENEQVRRCIKSLFGHEIPVSQQPSAIVCYDENAAAIAGQALSEMGRRVGVDISLAAFNDTPRVAEAMNPPLTTMRAPVVGICDLVVHQLYLIHDMDEESDTGSHDLALPSELIIRASCAPRESVLAA